MYYRNEFAGSFVGKQKKKKKEKKKIIERKKERKKERIARKKLIDRGSPTRFPFITLSWLINTSICWPVRGS